MSDKFKNKYRNGTFRLRGYDYRREGVYFITIPTQNKIPYFGEIISGEKPCLDATKIAKIAEEEWLKTPGIRPDMNLILDEFVFMPDHFHALLCIGNNKFNVNSQRYKLNKFGPQRKNLASIIGGFKSAVTTYARKNDIEFDWQRLFYESIIRNETHFRYVQQYILDNPYKWNRIKK